MVAAVRAGAISIVLGLVWVAARPVTAEEVDGDQPATTAQASPLGDRSAELERAARTAMAAGRFAEARVLFARLVVLDPYDAGALREAGRCAHALGDLEYAERALGQAQVLRGIGVPDPELHYLRGEALLALGRRDEAWRELHQAELELPRDRLDRTGTLWLARFLALRGDVDGADALLRRWVPRDLRGREFEEITMARASAQAVGRRWWSAEKLLRAFLVERPGHGPGRELLAWVLEAQGHLDEELQVRAGLAAEPGPERAGRLLRYGRALERDLDYPGALARYRAAAALGAGDLSRDITRMAHRVAPEVAARVSFADDPTGSVLGVRAGGTITVGSRVRVGVAAASDRGAEVGGFTRSAIGVQAVVTHRAAQLALGPTFHGGGGYGLDVGGRAALRVRPARRFELHGSAELGLPWTESAVTNRDGGEVDALGLDLYRTVLGDRLVLGLGARARRLVLPARGDVPAAAAGQLLGVAGADLVVWSAPGRTARGEMFDDDLTWASPLAPALVLSYRHYEATAGDELAPRIVLAQRSAIDELSAVIRQVIDPDGIFAVEARGGAGYDRARDVAQWRAGASVLVSPSPISRVAITFDSASESVTGFVGRRHTGMVSLHVDL